MFDDECDKNVCWNDDDDNDYGDDDGDRPIQWSNLNIAEVCDSINTDMTCVCVCVCAHCEYKNNHIYLHIVVLTGQINYKASFQADASVRSQILSTLPFFANVSEQS